MLKRLSSPDLRLLRVFHEVARLKGFTAAEGALELNQPTISNHIKTLESRLGLSLCERGRAGFRLTHAGEQLFQATQTLERQLAGFASMLSQIREQISGHVRIGMPHILSRFPNLVGVPKAIARIREQNPDIQVEIHLDHLQEIVNGVIEGRYDLGIGPLQARSGKVDVIPLFKVPANIYCARSHPLFSRGDRHITAAELRKCQSVMHQFDLESQKPFDPARATLTRSSETSVFYVLSGQYIGYLSEYVAEPWRQKGELRAIRPETFGYQAAGGIAMQKQRMHSALLRVVTDALVASHREAASADRPASTMKTTLPGSTDG
ncbi:MAG: LysR family transcriptional regulator [Steroidobacteraceae bacterium]